MMLVISVIVAIAILGVLLNILGGISFGVSKPSAVITDGLKEIASKGFGVTQPKESTFDDGTLVLRKEVIGDTPIQPEELAFACSDRTVCDSTKLDVKDDKIDAKAKVKVYITVCGDDTSKEKLKYCVGVGRQAGSSRDECTKKCRIT